MFPFWIADYTQLSALALGGEVAYVLSIKRLSVIVLAFIGIVRMKKSFHSGKIFGVVCMMLGCFLISTD